MDLFTSHGRAKAGRPARTYIQQLCAVTGCSPEDLPEAIDDREGWPEMVMMMTVNARRSKGSRLSSAIMSPFNVEMNDNRY